MARERKLRVMWLGFRGFPDVMGGVETHAEHICPRLVELGCEVEAIVRSPYLPADKGENWRGVRYRRIWSPRSKGLEAIVHTFLGVLYAGLRRPDVLHIQAIGPAIMTPLARLLGLRVVVTHHGPDYDRQKWGRFAKTVLELGERFGMRFANAAIVISETIQSLVRDKYGVDTERIPNGVVLPELPDSTGALREFGLEPGRYVLMVSRLVPEKRHEDLIEAFERASPSGWKLALVGAADHPNDYSRRIEGLAQDDERIVMTGYQSGLALRELYSHAGVFVLPSSHEGLPIALLEALSYGLHVVASDIPANLEVALPDQQYFPLGDTRALASALQLATNVDVDSHERREQIRSRVSSGYNWEDIARATHAVYGRIGSG